MTDKPLNPYGDKLILTDGSHGADISSQRLDVLDQGFIDMVESWSQEAFEGLHAQASPLVVAYDIGCGSGAVGKAAASGRVMSVFSDLNRNAALDAFVGDCPNSRFFQRDLSSDHNVNPEGNYIDIVLGQRFGHYMHASRLSALARSLNYSGASWIYFSVSGINTELSRGYVHKEAPLHERFAPLAQDMADKHSIHAPVCLYSKDDLAFVMDEGGYEAVDVTESAFGNIKGIFRRKDGSDQAKGLKRPIASPLSLVFEDLDRLFEFSVSPEELVRAFETAVLFNVAHRCYQGSVTRLREIIQNETPEDVLRILQQRSSEISALVASSDIDGPTFIVGR